MMTFLDQINFRYHRKTMKTLLKRSTVLLGLMTCAVAQFPLSASADSTAGLILSLKCPSEYTVNIWKRYRSGELLYRGTGLLGNLSLGKGTEENTGAAQVYKFKRGNYTYQVLGGKGNRQEQGTLQVSEKDRSIVSQTCRRE